MILSTVARYVTGFDVTFFSILGDILIYVIEDSYSSFSRDSKGIIGIKFTTYREKNVRF